MGYNSIIFRLEINHEVSTFGEVANSIGKAGGDIVSIDVIRTSKSGSVRDITVHVSELGETAVAEALQQLEGVTVVNVSDRTFFGTFGR